MEENKKAVEEIRRKRKEETEAFTRKQSENVVGAMASLSQGEDPTTILAELKAIELRIQLREHEAKMEMYYAFTEAMEGVKGLSEVLGEEVKKATGTLEEALNDAKRTIQDANDRIDGMIAVLEEEEHS